MGYVENNLLKDEEIKYVASIHWAAFLPGIFWTIIATIATLSFDSELVFIPAFLWLFATYRFLKGLFLKLFTECVLTNTRIIYKFGLISRRTLELQLNKCEGVSVDQGLLGRMLGFGTVRVTTGGPTNRFPVISDPITFRNRINEQIDLVHSASANKVAKTIVSSVADNKPIQQTSNPAEEIRQLSELLKQGMITEDEFRTMKDRIINKN